MARPICSAGFSDSAAAIVTISVPMKLNIVVSTAATTAPMPFGRKPPWSNSRDAPLTSLPGSRPSTASTPMAMNAMIATTLSSANQNSNSPYFATLNRFVAVSASVIASAHTHWATAGIQS